MNIPMDKSPERRRIQHLTSNDHWVSRYGKGVALAVLVTSAVYAQAQTNRSVEVNADSLATTIVKQAELEAAQQENGKALARVDEKLDNLEKGQTRQERMMERIYNEVREWSDGD